MEQGLGSTLFAGGSREGVRIGSGVGIWPRAWRQDSRAALYQPLLLALLCSALRRVQEWTLTVIDLPARQTHTHEPCSLAKVQ